MKVYGETITEHQISAAKRAMRDTFRCSDVERALGQTGLRGLGTIGRAADRLLQQERKAGRIAVNPENKREWRAVMQETNND